ncbi:MAG: SEC-C metal-binding domain-containing protein [Lentisphaeria bacterium]|nr:SEC-C metal-binding domain-containing protein [Lentisphaeria bacterium]
MSGLGRNEPCRCGSGRKYKKCCLAKDENEARVAHAAAEADRRQSDEEAGMTEKDADTEKAKPVKERGAPFAGKDGFREQANRSGRSGMPAAGWSRSSTGNR